ncbi:MAG TPA: B-box zinc finger protein [Candidatus Acidoferrum sp.]|nr:B-box zinc finger protein [Candidatus Acidoferrum sp.]
MKCAVHTDADATGYCRNCGKPMCPDCIRPVRDVLYCEDCLATILGHPAPVSQQTAPAGFPPQVPVAAVPPGVPFAAGSNPALAFFLGFLPGLGAFYNEQYGKGMIHLAIFLLLFITGVNGLDNGGAEAALWICISAFWIYMPIDALRTAQAKRSGQVLTDPLDSFSKEKPVGPIILIGVGILLLLSNFEWFQWYRFAKFWPLVLIAVGIFMFMNRMERKP